MRYSLLDYLACPHCHHELIAITHRESAIPVPHAVFHSCERVSAEGARVGPATAGAATSPVGQILAAHATPAATPDRNFDVEVGSGLLVCTGCGRWYPVRDSIPELLPDHLRDWQTEAAFLASVSESVPGDALPLLDVRARDADAAVPGERHKRAEIDLPRKIDDPHFWGPGHTAPFNMLDPDHSWRRIQSFVAAVPLLGLRRGDAVLDAGVGYCWTSEWLFRSGYDVVAMDICRAYVEIGIRRMGPFRPHVVIGDVEAPPIRSGSMPALLCVESFHHVPHRQRAFAAFSRVLRAGGVVLLAEPGAGHGLADTSIDVMDKYGTLEKGMELEDVRRYCVGSMLTDVRQHFVVHLTDSELVVGDSPWLRSSHSVLAGNLFTARKGSSVTPGRGLPSPRAPSVLVRRAALKMLTWLVPRVRSRIARVVSWLER